MLVDSHCHLDFEVLNEQLPDVLARAKEAGVDVMQTICTRVTQFEKIHAIAKEYPHIYCSVGVHPNNVGEEPEVEVETLVELGSQPKVIGIGETGLDYYYAGQLLKEQQVSFKKHIDAARQLQLPLIVHTRDADDDTMDILESEYQKGEFPGLIHCFTATEKLAKRAMDIGFYISISGIVTFKNAKDLQAIVKQLPLERLLVETDAPYLAPQPHRGKTNEPAFTKHTAEFIAQLKSLPYEVVAKQTTDNFYQLFQKAEA
jgi:TatD DNase family protein